jgi:hypothetical protein
LVANERIRIGPSIATPDVVWGAGEVSAVELKALLVPHKDDALIMWPVNRQKIGNARNKDREVASPETIEDLP